MQPSRLGTVMVNAIRSSKSLRNCTSELCAQGTKRVYSSAPVHHCSLVTGGHTCFNPQVLHIRRPSRFHQGQRTLRAGMQRQKRASGTDKNKEALTSCICVEAGQNLC